VQEAGGTLRAESNTPKGARFLLRLPLIEHADSAGPENGINLSTTEVRS